MLVTNPKLKIYFSIAIILFGFLLSVGCKKEEDVVKKIDYITKNNGNLRIDYVYDGDQVEEVIYDYKYFKEKYFFENGMLVRAELQNDMFIDYIFSDSIITAVHSWSLDKKHKEYFYNTERHIYKKIDYLYSYNVVTSEYKYQNGNLIEKKRTGGPGVTFTNYTYDNHPNPYRIAPLYDELYMLSVNNMLTANGERVAEYKYDKSGYLIESESLPTIVDKFYYK